MKTNQKVESYFETSWETKKCTHEMIYITQKKYLSNSLKRVKIQPIFQPVYIYLCGNRINLVHDSEFHASSKSSGIYTIYFYLPKKKTNKNTDIPLPYQNTKYNFPDFKKVANLQK